MEFWEEFKDGYLYFGQWSFLISRSGDTLKVDEEVLCRDNDSGRKLALAPTKIYGVCKCNYDDFVKKYRELFPNRCKSPKVNFGRKVDGLPWSRMGRIYSIK